MAQNNMTPRTLYQHFRRARLGYLLLTQVHWEHGACTLNVNLRDLVRHCFGIQSGFCGLNSFQLRPKDTECICLYGSAVSQDLTKSFPADLDVMVIARHNPHIEKKINPERYETAVSVLDDPFGGYYGGSSGTHQEIRVSEYAPIHVSGDVPPGHSKQMGVHIVYRSITDFHDGVLGNDELSQCVHSHGVPLVGVDAFAVLTAELSKSIPRCAVRTVHWSGDNRSCWSARA